MLFRLLLQGLATNTCLSELELDISCCEVQTHTHLHIKELSKSFLKMLCVILCYCSWGRLELRWFRNTSSRPRPSAVWTCLTTVPSLILFSLHAASTLLTSLHTFLFISVRFIILLSMTNSFTTALERLQGLSSHQVINHIWLIHGEMEAWINLTHCVCAFVLLLLRKPLFTR